MDIYGSHAQVCFSGWVSLCTTKHVTYLPRIRMVRTQICWTRSRAFCLRERHKKRYDRNAWVYVCMVPYNLVIFVNKSRESISGRIRSRSHGAHGRFVNCDFCGEAGLAGTIVLSVDLFGCLSGPSELAATSVIANEIEFDDHIFDLARICDCDCAPRER